MRYMITDSLWAALGPVVDRSKRNRSGQKPVLPDRMFFEALLYLARTGVADGSVGPQVRKEGGRP
jgi:putative transposase